MVGFPEDNAVAGDGLDCKFLKSLTDPGILILEIECAEQHGHVQLRLSTDLAKLLATKLYAVAKQIDAETREGGQIN